MNTIDERLWNYIDGISSSEEMLAINELLGKNNEIKKLYDKYAAIHQLLQAAELEEPSLRFTQNIMEVIAHEPAPKIVKTKVNIRIIKGIGGFFLLSIVSLLIYTISQIHWGTSSSSTILFRMPEIDWYRLVNRNLLAFIVVDEIAGLFLLDKFLRKKILHEI